MPTPGRKINLCLSLSLSLFDCALLLRFHDKCSSVSGFIKVMKESIVCCQDRNGGLVKHRSLLLQSHLLKVQFTAVKVSWPWRTLAKGKSGNKEKETPYPFICPYS